MSTKIRRCGRKSVMRRGCLCRVSVYLPCKLCHTGWGKGSRMNIPGRGREKVAVRRLCLYRELTAGAWGFQPGLRRSARSGPTGLHPHTGTEHRYWSSARMGEGKLHVRRVHSITGNQQYVRTFTSQIVQMLHKEPGRNACLSEADSSSSGNTLHFRH